MQFTIRLPDEYGEKIEVLAKKMGLKRSDFISLAVELFIEDHCGENDSRPSDKVKHLLGTAESGIKDLGKRHRHHLIKKFKKASSCMY